MHFIVPCPLANRIKLRLTASRTGDSIALATTSGTDNVTLDRLFFDDGSAITNAVFQNVNVGINGTPSGAYSLEVAGNASFSTGLYSGGDADFSAQSLLNVSAISSSDENTEQAQILLTSDDASPKIDLVLGDLANTPTTVASFDESLVSIATPASFGDDVTINGNLNVTGTQVVLNTTAVEVQDINIEMGSEATSHTDIDGAEFCRVHRNWHYRAFPVVLRGGRRWQTSVSLHVPSDSSLTVGSTTEVTNSSVALKSDSSEMFSGRTSSGDSVFPRMSMASTSRDPTTTTAPRRMSSKWMFWRKYLTNFYIE